MGDRAWAAITIYSVGGPQEVEALCAFIDDHLGWDDDAQGSHARLTALQVWGDYEAGEVSLGFCDKAESLAAQTPGSIWALSQDGYSGAGEAVYHVPGLGLWRCSEDGGPIFSRDEVLRMLEMDAADCANALGTPWLTICKGLAEVYNDLPSEQRPTFPRPKEDDDAPRDTATAG